MRRINVAVLPFCCLLSAFSVHPRLAAASSIDVQVQQACAALQRTPLAPAELQTLADASRSATNSPALRSRAMAVCSLSLLMQGNTQAFERAVSVLKAVYPDAAALIAVGRADAFAVCKACQGAGRQTTLCPSCMGSGTCKICAGTGKKDDAVCRACKGSGHCGMCQGKGKLSAVCATCKGTGEVFHPDTRIAENFNALLAGLVTVCTENTAFEDAFKHAAHEPDVAKRANELQTLRTTFAHRTDLLADAQTLWDQTTKALEHQREQEAKAQANRDLDALRMRAELEAPAAVLAAVDAYLAANPATSVRADLQALRDRLSVRCERQSLLRTALYAVLALVGIVLVVGVVRSVFFRKKHTHVCPLPGIDKLDKSAFIDPLTLTSIESKERSHSHEDRSS